MSRNLRRKLSLQLGEIGLVARNPTPELKELCSTSSHRLQRDRSGGSSIEETLRPLYDESPLLLKEEWICIPHGLVPAITGFLGTDASVGIDLLPLPAPILQMGMDCALVTQMGHSRHLTICHGAAAGPGAIVAEAAKAFPSALIIVNVDNNKEIDELLSELRTFGIHPVRRLGQSEPSAQVVVGLPLDHGNYHTSAEFIFTIGRRTALGGLGTVPVKTSPRARQILLLPIDERLSESEYDRIHAHFGFAKLALPRIGYRRRQVKVTWSQYSGGSRALCRSTALNLKRTGIKRNPCRNRHVAKLAKAAAGECGGIRHECVENLFGPLEGRAASGVAVLAADVTHAIEIAQRLPGWRLIAGGEFTQADLSDWERGILSRPPEQIATGPRLIVTMAGIANAPWLAIDTLIRADGGPGMPGLKLRDLTVLTQHDRPLFLIDLVDRHDPQFRKWTRSRKAAYLKNEWSAARGNATDERIKSFIERRTGGI